MPNEPKITKSPLGADAPVVQFPNEVPGEVEKTFRDKGYAVLGEHGQDAVYVQGNFIRVRFFLDKNKDEYVDEDLPQPTAKTYEELVAELCEARLDKLKKDKIK